MKNMIKNRVFTKALTMLLAIAMIMSSMSTAFVFAADGTDAYVDGPIFRVSSVEAMAGDTVSVNITVENNPGIQGAVLTLNYPEVLTLEKTIMGDVFETLNYTKPGKFEPGCNLTWYGNEIAAEDIMDGLVMTLVFKVSDAAVAGKEYEIELSCDGTVAVVNPENLASPFKAVPSFKTGVVSVIDYIPGDVNSDKAIDIYDVIALSQYVAKGYDVVIKEPAGDVNADAVIDIYDVIALSQYVAGGYGVELKPSPLKPVLPECKHENVEFVPGFEPTCSKDGAREHYKCANCGELFFDADANKQATASDFVLAATGEHATGDWIIVREPTPAMDGEKQKVCGVCDKVIETESIPYSGDSWDPNTSKLPGYEDIDFGGQQFIIAGYKGAVDGYDNEQEVYSNGTDAISVAANQRTTLIEKLYHCDVVFRGAENPSTYVSAAAAGGEPVHLAAMKYAAQSSATGGQRYNLANYLDLGQGWWDQNYVESMTFTSNGGVRSLYSIVGDFSLHSYTSTVALMFNRGLFVEIFGDEGLSELYQLVRDGRFTMDKLAEYITKGAVDRDSDGIISSENGDIAGMITPSSVQGFGFTKAADLRIIDQRDNRYYVAAADLAEQWVSVIDKARELNFLNGHEITNYSTAEAMMAAGNALFYSEVLGHAASESFQNSDVELSIVPFPKYSESQERYSHLVENHLITYSVPTSVANVDEVANFFTVYAAHTTGIVRPAFLDTYGYEYFSGAESREMLEIVFDSRDYDPGYTLFSSMFSIFYSQVSAESNQIVMQISRWTENWNNTINTFYDSVSKNNGEVVTPPDDTTNPDTNPPDTTNPDTAPEATAYETRPIFARFDFGTDSKAQDHGLTAHAYLVEALTFNDYFVDVQWTEDSVILTAKQDQFFNEDGTLMGSRTDFALCYDVMEDLDQLDKYNLTDYLWNGYGTWGNALFTGNYTKWQGGAHEYCKIRIKNHNTQNNVLTVQFSKSMSPGMYTTTMANFIWLAGGPEVLQSEANIGAWQTVTFSMAYLAGVTRAVGRGDVSSYNAAVQATLGGINYGSNWVWNAGTVEGLRFYLLSSSGYGDAFLDKTADTRRFIKAGDTVEVDYIVFGASAEQLAGYTSKLEDNTEHVHSFKAVDGVLVEGAGDCLGGVVITERCECGDERTFETNDHYVFAKEINLSAAGACGEHAVYRVSTCACGEVHYPLYTTKQCSNVTTEAYELNEDGLISQVTVERCGTCGLVITTKCYSLTDNATGFTADFTDVTVTMEKDGMVTELGVFSSKIVHDFEYATTENGFTYVAGIGNAAIIDGQLRIPAVNSKGEQVVGVGYAAFEGNQKITSVVIEEGIYWIEPWAFNKCANLSSVSLPSTLSNINSYAFQETALTEVTLPEKLTNIGNYAFNNCTALTSINLPAGLRSIGSYAFRYTALSEVNVPACTNGIGNYAFAYISTLTKVTLAEGLASIGVGAFRETSITEIVIPGSVKEIGNSAFAYCYRLANVTINEGVVRIGEHAFREAAITTLELPASVEVLDYAAFALCCNLTSVTLSENLSHIDEWVFEQSALTSVEIPASVRFIGYGAFGNSVQLSSVVLNEGVRRIDNYAFGNTQIKSIELPDSLVHIGREAFPTIETTVYNNGVYLGDSGNPYEVLLRVENSSAKTFELHPDTKLLANASIELWNMTSLTLPEGLRGMADFAIHSQITSLEIPASVAYIAEGAFVNSGRLAEIILAEGNTAYCMENGALYDANKNVLLYYPSESAAASFTVAEGVVRIARYAFEDSNLQEIILPASLQVIGERAFAYAYNLSTLHIPANVHTIESQVFMYGSSLSAITVDSENKNFYADGGVLYNRNGALLAYPSAKADNVFKIPSNVYEIAEYAFANAYNLCEVAIPASVRSISTYSIYNCNNLMYFNVATNSNYFRSSDGVLYNRNMTTLIAYPGGKQEETFEIPEGVTTINVQAVRNNNLKYIVVPESVQIINSNAFTSSRNLATITINNANCRINGRIVQNDVIIFGHEGSTAQNYANQYGNPFYVIGTEFEGTLEYGYRNIDGEKRCVVTGIGTYQGTELVIPATNPNGEAVYGIDNWAFEKNENITSLVIEEGVQYIYNGAFCGCRNLASVTFPSTLKEIGGSAFEACEQLSSIRLPVALEGLGNWAFAGCQSLCEVTFEGNNLGVINSYAFRDCQQLTSIEIPEGVGVVDREAFAYCHNLQNVTLPESLTYIGNEAFWGTNMIEISIPSSVDYVGEYAFSEMVWRQYEDAYYIGNAENPYHVLMRPFDTSITTFTINPNTKVIAGRALEWTSITSITIPEGVVSIGPSAFQGTNIQSLHLPASVYMLGENALGYISSLETLTVSADNGSYTAVDNVLFNKSMDTLILYPQTKPDTSYAVPASVRYIAFNAFANATKLKAITLPANLEEIAQYAFTNCNALAEISIPAGVYHIGSLAFVDCRNLTAITVAEENPNYRSVDGVLFSEDMWELIVYPANKAGEAYVIPESVGYIEEYAFNRVQNLKSVTIPANYDNGLDMWTFWNAESLAEIIVPSGNPGYQSIDGVLYSADGRELIYYPAGKTDETFTIPASVTAIRLEAVHNSYLKTVVFPANVQTIDCQAFWRCDNLESVTIENPNAYICCNAFRSRVIIYGHAGSTAEQFANNYGHEFVSLDEEAPTGTLEFTSYGDGTCVVSGIGTYQGTDVVIPETSPNGEQVVRIEARAFGGNQNITSVTIAGSVKNIEYGAFENCPNLVSVTFSEGVEYIEAYAFANSGLRNVVLADSVIYVGYQAFNSVSGIWENNAYYIGSATNPYHMLVNTELGNATSYVVHEDVKIIGGYAMAYGFNLTSVTLPEELRSIDFRAFNRCVNLQSLTIPKNVVLIGDYVFGNTMNLEVFEVDPENPAYCAVDGVLFTKDMSVLVRYPAAKTDTSYVIPETVKTIMGEAFAYAENLVSVYIPASVEGDFSNTFKRCASLTDIQVAEDNPWYCVVDGVLFTKDMWKLIAYPAAKADTSYAIPEGVERIEYHAFSAANNLTSISIPASVTRIHNPYEVFWYCDNLTEFVVAEDNSRYHSIDGVLYEGTQLIYYPAGKSDMTFTVPEGISEIEVEAIINPYLADVVFPESVETIQGNAFDQCTALGRVTILNPTCTIYEWAIPDSDIVILGYADSTAEIYANDHGNPFVEITAFSEYLDGILYSENRTTLISYPSYKTDTLLNIPESVNTVGRYAISNPHVNVIVFPESVSYVNANAVWGCDRLTSVTFHNPDCLIEDGAIIAQDIVICGYTGSTAEVYANNNGHPFLALDASSDMPTAVVGPHVITKDANNIVKMDYLDFHAEMNAVWAMQDENENWECFIEPDAWVYPQDENWNVIGPYINSSFRTDTAFSFVENGEALRFEVTGSNNTTPGLHFVLDEAHDGVIPVGTESASNPKAEYVKIRVRNYSAADRFTFAFVMNHTNGGKFVAATVSDLKVDMTGKQYESFSGEWQTYIFSMADINAATNYDELLQLDQNGDPISRWGGCMYGLVFFPFGYNVEDGTGAYVGAMIDIDYCVIGSLDYVSSYKSALEMEEETVVSLEINKMPTKTTYYLGETLDLSGLELVATYANGTSKVITATSYAVNMDVVSDSTPVILKYGSLSVSFNIRIIDPDTNETEEMPA